MILGEIRREYVYGSLDGMAECAGQELLISSNRPLFALLGNQFGGNGFTSFCLPNLPVKSGPKHYIAMTGHFPILD
ncbi:MAG: tail fiber protein [Microthrixaceae bacterium]